MIRRQLYIDPVLQSKIKIKKIKKHDPSDFQDIVALVWQSFLKNDFVIHGYKNDKGRYMSTTDMKGTTVALPKDLSKAIDDELDKYNNVESESVYFMSFSLVTNELLDRIYIKEEI